MSLALNVVTTLDAKTREVRILGETQMRQAVLRGIQIKRERKQVHNEVYAHSGKKHY